MKKKIVISGLLTLGCFALCAPLLAKVAMSSAIGVAAASRVDVTMNDIQTVTTGASADKSTHVFFTLPENSLAAYDDGTNRFKATAASNVLVHVAADGTRTSHAANICKANTSTYYVEFDNWSGDKFEVKRGESIILNGTAARANGDTLVFANIELKHTVYGMWLKDAKINNVGENDLSLSSATAAKNIYFTYSGTFDTPFAGKWDVALRSEDEGAKVITASGEELRFKHGIRFTSSNTLYIGIGASWAGVDINYNFAEGDKLVIENGVYSTTYNSVLYRYTVARIDLIYTHGNWDLNANVHEASYSAMDIDYLDEIGYGSNYASFRVHLTKPNDEFPINSDWNANAKAATTIYPVSGEPVTRNARLVKSAASTYTFIWGNLWGTGDFYPFQAGDRVVIDTSFARYVGYEKYMTTFHNWEFTYNGETFIVGRGGTLASLLELIPQLGDEAQCTPEYESVVLSAYRIYKGLTQVEKLSIGKDNISKILKRYREYNRLVAEAAGKTIHFTQVDAESIISANSSDGSGAIIKHNQYDFPLEPIWDKSNFLGDNDITMTRVDGTVIDLSSKAVFNTNVTTSFVFVPWGPKNAFEHVMGDLLEFKETGYIYQNDTDFYEIEYPEFSMIWTGLATAKTGAWRMASEVSHLREMITKVSEIGSIEYNEECKAKIDAARDYYDAIPEEERELYNVQIENDIIAAENAYLDLENQNGAQECVALIDAIGAVEYTEECKAKIDAARAAYDALNADAKAYVGEEKASVLAEAEATYADLKAGAEADECIALIDAIGTVEYTEESKAKIDAARECYNSLDDAAQDKVPAEKLEILDDAEARYDMLRSADAYICLVATLNENSSLEQIYSVVAQANAIYDLVEDKSVIADAMATLQTYVDKYNSTVTKANENQDKGRDAAFSAIGISFGATAMAALGLALLKKKGIL